MTDRAKWQELEKAARKARSQAYAPYSGFTVGAALQTKGGAVFVGCNVENASYGATICAERAALAAAVAAGERDLVALAIVSGAKDPITPCGICRQCLSELASGLSIRSFTDDQQADFELRALLPDAFDEASLT